VSSPAVDIKDILVAAGVATFAGTSESSWALYVDNEPETPSNVVTVYDDDGVPPTETIDPTDEPIEQPIVQIRVRGVDYETAYTKIQECLTACKKLPFELNGSGYGSLARIDEVQSLGTDLKNRHRLVVSIMATRQAPL
jgi:hypothetical protein